MHIAFQNHVIVIVLSLAQKMIELSYLPYCGESFFFTVLTVREVFVSRFSFSTNGTDQVKPTSI